MLKYHELIEKKLGNVGSPGQSTKNFERDAHSQGIDLGAAEIDSHHIKYPNATFRRGGKPARKSDGTPIGGDLDGKGKFHSQKHTHGNTLRDAVKGSGRVSKTPAAKAERAKEAAENKAAKKKNRDPFTREHTEWWVDMWRLDEGEQEEARRRKQMRDGRLPKEGINTSPKPSVQPKSTPALSASPDVAAARKQRKAREANARPAQSANTDVAAARERRKAREAEQKKPTPSSRPQGPRPDYNKVKPKSALSTAPTQRKVPEDNEVKKDKTPQEQAARERKREAQGAKNIAQRKQGIRGGIRSALGGDVIGMKPGKNETDAERRQRTTMNKKAKGDFAKKKVQQTGNLAKSTASSALNSALKPSNEPEVKSTGGNTPDIKSREKSYVR